ncbi:signal-induced proliferation-associated 1-like protein 3 [Dissophora globulifera]|nr:signal-induced proliferation-associated 1-like protein 3 [Dissophora globulifera]
MAVPPETSSYMDPVTRSTTIFKDTMNTFAIASEHTLSPDPEAATEAVADTSTTSVTDASIVISSSLPLLLPSSSPSLLPLSTLKINGPLIPALSIAAAPEQSLPTSVDSTPFTSDLLVHIQPVSVETTISFTNTTHNNLNRSTQTNIDAGTGTGTGTGTSIDVHGDNIESIMDHPLPASTLMTLHVHSDLPTSHGGGSQAGSKSHSFFGSLSPKNSKQMINKQSKKASRPPSPSPRAPSPSPPPPELSASASLLQGSALQSSSANDKCYSRMHISSKTASTDTSGQSSGSSGVESQDVQELVNCKSRGVKNSGKKQPKNKENHHPHLGQRLSMAIGFSSSALSTAQQRGRRGSLDFFLRRDTSGQQESTPEEMRRQSGVSGNQDKEKKGGLMAHFLRPRQVQTSDSPIPVNVDSSPAIQGSLGVETHCGSINTMTSSPRNAAQNGFLTPLSTPSKSGAISATASDSSVHSGHRPDLEENSGNESDRKRKSLRGIHGHARGSSGSGFSLMIPSALKHRRGSTQMLQTPELASQRSIGPIESSKSALLHHDFADRERADLCNRLGLQEIHYREAAAEDPKEVLIRQQYIATGRRHSLSPLALPSSSLNQEVLQNSTAFGSMSSITSSSSALAQPAHLKSSSRLGRLGRFKFPSLSMGGAHKSKTTADVSSARSSQEPVPTNIRRGSLSALINAPPLEQPLQHTSMQCSGSASTFTSVDTTGMTTLGETTPGSSSQSSISSNHKMIDTNTRGGISGDSGRKSRQSLLGFMEDQTHHPHHSSTAIANTEPMPFVTKCGTVDSNPRSTTRNRNVGHHNTMPNHQRSVAKSIFGSERFTSSTSGLHRDEHAAVGQPGRESGISRASRELGLTPRGTISDAEHSWSIQSPFTKWASRRTVSASHISSFMVFAANDSDVGVIAQPASHQNHPPAMRHFRSERDMHAAASLRPQTKDAFKLDITTAGGGRLAHGQDASIGQHSPGVSSSSVNTELRQPPCALSSTVDPAARGSRSESFKFGVQRISSATPTVSTRPISSATSKDGLKSSIPPKPPLSPAAVANSKMCRDNSGSPGYYTFPLSLLPPPSTASGTSTSAASSPTPGRPKFSIKGSSSPSVPGRPSFSYNHSNASTAITSALNLATISKSGNSNKSTAKSTVYQGPALTPNATPRNPNIPHLEPRSAVADYSPIIHYKRQRSMSLQDADLLTADQFIALMPDDLLPKRRFSSEETLPDNAWYMNAKSKKAPQPDPAAALRSLLGTLKTKCNLVMNHIDVVSASVSDPAISIMTEGLDSVKVTTALAETPVKDQMAQLASATIEQSSGFREQNLTRDSGAVVGKRDSASNVAEFSTNAVSSQDSSSAASTPQSPIAVSARSEKIDFTKDLVESVTTLFDEMDHTITRMLEILSKYIPTESLSKLSKDLDDMCFLAQDALRVETAKHRHMEPDEKKPTEPKFTTPTQLHQEPHNTAINTIKAPDMQQPQQQHRYIDAAVGTRIAPMITRVSGESESSDARRITKKDSKDRMPNLRGHGPRKHQYRYRPQGRESEDSVKAKDMTSQEQATVVKDYIRSVLEAADTCVSEYLRVYNRMFVFPTSGYRIEGCNDHKKIERALRSDHPPAKVIPMSAAASGPPQTSLLSRAAVVQSTPNTPANDNTNGGPSNVFRDSGVAHPPQSPGANGEERIMVDLSAAKTMTSQMNTSSSGGQAMMRVKSLPESKDEWAALQKRKEMGGSAGVAGAISMGSPAAVGIGGGGGSAVAPSNTLSAGAGVVSGPDMSMLGDYSKEHMGHEAYYYRNWFLGKEHRTFVGQVEGLGTVIISIIKDMVIPAEPKLLAPGRANTLPLGSHQLATVVTGSGSSENQVQASTGSSVQTGVTLYTTSTGLVAPQATTHGGLYPSNSLPTPNNNVQGNSPPRWQYRCILRQKDYDSLRITLPEPELGPLNNLTRRVGKPQWKTILQSIHPAITQQVVSKLKKVQTNPQFEKELAKFDETMLRFNYKFGVLLVHPGQTKEEDWFGNQMESSPAFQDFLQSGVLGQKVTLKGFERFSAGLDTRLGEAGVHSYYDTWGDGFEIMYHVSTLLPFNTEDRQQIQRKRHIGNDIVCIIFVDGDQPFIPNTIKSQFLHIFVIVHMVSLADGTKGYSVAIACDEQVPEFGPALPDPPVFRTPQELRAYLLCKMINGENAAYKAPRLIKPHQRARSGMLENLVTKANCLTKDKDTEKKTTKHQRPVATTPSAMTGNSMLRTAILITITITAILTFHMDININININIPTVARVT